MFKLIGSFICLISLDYVESRWLPNTKLTTKGSYLYFPEDMDPKVLKDMKIPNRAYCLEKYKKSLNRHLIMPWWYNYCEGLREKSLKSADNKMIRYRYVLKQLREYRRNGGTIPEKIKLPTAKTKRL